MFGAASDIRRDALSIKCLMQPRDNPLNNALTRVAPQRELAADLLVLVGIKDRKRAVLELPFNLPDTKSMRERRVDVERLTRVALLALRRHNTDRPHIMQPVSQLNQH